MKSTHNRTVRPIYQSILFKFNQTAEGHAREDKFLFFPPHNFLIFRAACGYIADLPEPNFDASKLQSLIQADFNGILSRYLVFKVKYLGN